MRKKASLKRLKLSNYKLETLLDITQAINDNQPTEQLLGRYSDILTEELNIGKVLVFSFNKKWEKLLNVGINDEQTKDICVDTHLHKYTEISNLSATARESDKLEAFDVVIPVHHKNTPLAYVLIGDIDEERSGISPTIKHLHFVQTLTNVIIVAIENKRLFKEYIRQETIRKELEVASRMQNMLIPDNDKLPSNKYIHTTAYYKPHFEVGGDYYDMLELSKEEVGFCIADVSGKGISAALLMSNFQASLRALFTKDIDLKELILKLNDIVINNTKGEKFITLFIAKYNCKTKEINYINCGHNPPILFDTQRKKAAYLMNGCIGLGMLNKIPKIKQGLVKVAPGSKLLCYTDGLVEVENESMMEFGTEEIENAVTSHEKIDGSIKEIISKVDQHRGAKSFFDDISIIAMELY